MAAWAPDRPGAIVETPDGLGRVAALTSSSVLVDLFRPVATRLARVGKDTRRHDVFDRWYVRRDVRELDQP